MQLELDDLVYNYSETRLNRLEWIQNHCKRRKKYKYYHNYDGHYCQWQMFSAKVIYTTIIEQHKTNHTACPIEQFSGCEKHDGGEGKF